VPDDLSFFLQLFFSKFFFFFFFFVFVNPLMLHFGQSKLVGKVVCFHERLLCWESGVAGVNFVDFATLCGVFPNYMLLCMGI
jgi:hypothetical protein